MSGPRLALIVARARNGVIGREGAMAWRLPDELAFFKRVTMGKPLCMGRKTWESLPKRPLPGRPNLVLSRDPSYAAEGAESFTTLDAMLARAREIAEESGVGEVMIIGGAALYAQTLGLAERLHLTDVDADIEGDVSFPAIDPADWVELEAVAHPADARHAYAFTMRTLERRGEKD